MKISNHLGLKPGKIQNLVAALLCAAVGMLFISIGLGGHYGISYEIIPQMLDILVFTPVYLSGTGLGIVFLVSSVFFVREAFSGGIFSPGTEGWPEGSKFCIFLVILWILVYVLMNSSEFF
ncbi:hypothetical protein J2128_001244 [Methanomicrobium sp. W14]|uniref:hypothetical protein n=1 Tax=Methanomicrobium sp. W14 TaxID=2817839 RepID=UPI001AE58EE6|nr:hypothetical protein [Methanomicrobium sp. W14]MBP2133290.1 hypothetical protein [Methanomicrobium sp. W14]